MKSVLRSLVVLESLAGRQPAGVSELARDNNLPISTVQRILTTLAEAGWVKPTDEPQTRWSLTNKSLIIGRRAGQERGLLDAAGAPMQSLCDDTGSTIYLGVPDELEHIVVVHRVDSTQQVRAFIPLGARGPLDVGSGGRALLAAMPDAAIDQVIGRGLHPGGDGRTESEVEFRASIEEIRRTGYAVSEGVRPSEFYGVAAAVLDFTKRPVATVAVSIPRGLFDPTQATKIGERTVQTAREIGERLDGI